MRFSPQEEYGLRCMLAIAKAHGENRSLTIPEISETEKIPEPTVAKILRLLRINGFLISERGHTGGYALSRAPEKIFVNELLQTLGGKLFDETSCEKFHADSEICIHIKNCNVRELWKTLQEAIDKALSGMTLSDLANLKIKNSVEKNSDA